MQYMLDMDTQACFILFFLAILLSDDTIQSSDNTNTVCSCNYCMASLLNSDALQ